MPLPFAKLFDTPHGQLLCFLDENEEGDPTIRIIGAAIDDIRPSASLSGWTTEDGQQREFDAIDQDKANSTAAQLYAAVAGFVG